ncbi:hypothetical protein [Dickeya zeae]|uniref:hypothetical protein n=1 Tax=Dickeya zeae TaxID=204042 RepID=UPI001443156F|nr:hypothetical protein [Dickeya zeae]
MGRNNVVIQVRGNGEAAKSVNGSTLKDSVDRSLRASFALEGFNVSDASWEKIKFSESYLTKSGK